jgi:ATP/maltotriose-dependent transcriptional regulator MalT
VYEFHPLFREFLLKRAGEFFTHEERDNIRRKAASLLLATGRTEEAAGLLCDAADWQGLTSLVIEAAKEFTAAGKFLTIGTWINKIPTDVVENDGGLLYWKAMCLMATRPSEAREHLEKA